HSDERWTRGLWQHEDGTGLPLEARARERLAVETERRWHVPRRRDRVADRLRALGHGAPAHVDGVQSVEARSGGERGRSERVGHGASWAIKVCPVDVTQISMNRTPH